MCAPSVVFHTSTNQVSARFPKGKKDLEVSFFQALVLRCFNRADRLSIAQIR